VSSSERHLLQAVALRAVVLCGCAGTR